MPIFNLVFAQVNVDKDPMEMAISPEIFTLLKKANPGRFEVLTDLFVHLGVDCQPQALPSLTPAFISFPDKVIFDMQIFCLPFHFLDPTHILLH